MANNKNVLIRGVDARAYSELSSFARRLGVSVGYLASQSFKLLIALLESTPRLAGIEGPFLGEILERLRLRRKLRRKPVFVRHIGRLVISARDLESSPGPVIFFGIGELEFDPSVSEDLFEKKVLKIVDCEKVVIPRHLDKIKVLGKTLFIGELVEKV